ncbi:isoleucine--tRNA ligase [Clostridia bacterium]|nr:isoleucine--tRNA ligase [Clostridia bacterium]
MADDYSNSLNLPKTDFPMRANLPIREKDILDNWNELDLYNSRLKNSEGFPAFILHDGPPFANGDIHTGHALNKVLKDVVIKSKAMTGHSTPYIPGWDTHGLPIEQQAIKKLKINKEDVAKSDFRKICEDFATKYVDTQREQFKRLGVLADWDNPYLTLQPEFEASQLRIFGDMVAKDYIYRGLKPVYWCTDCETALAEAEIEYADHSVDSIFVKFPVINSKNLPLDGASILIWTTTTWTLPANLAIAVNANYDYALVSANGEKLLMAKELLDGVMQTAGITDYEILETFKGSELEYVECKHPFIDRNSIVICGDLVTLEAGTGCVHIAPGHGMEDYMACRAYPEIPIIVPIDEKGVLNDLAGPFAGQYYAKANKTIKQFLEESGYLFSSKAIDHQYPHCWRCQNPIVFRATEQWFASVNDFKNQALSEIKKVNWVPKWGEERISNMIADRADWCISRQRLWGVPIPIFFCEECKEPLMSQDITNHVADIFAEKGSNAWFDVDSSELLPSGTKCSCGHDKFTKETDTMDVWFDSGTSHSGVLENRANLSVPADMYLEGNDQYRGWFQSSLLTSVAHSGKAPFKTVLTHGFVVDGDGRKMSKSIGNGLPPEDIIKQYGADILRLWVVSSDYKADIKISPEILKQLSEIYRKIRNTARFILGNISDFSPETDSVSKEDMKELDLWALMRLNQLIEKVRSSYETYDYHIIYHAIHNFCVVDMSTFYLDIIKDRLYTERANSQTRRSAQTVMYKILDSLVRILAPVISFTADEIWEYLPHASNSTEPSIHLAQFPEVDNTYFSDELEAKWNKIIAIREDVSKSLEVARNNKLIGNSLEAKVTLIASGKSYEFLSDLSPQLADIFIVSEVELLKNDSAETGFPLEIKIDKVEGQKCPRCWIYHKDDNELCNRCDKIVNG